MGKTLEDFMEGGFEQLKWPDDGEVNVQYLGQEIVATKWGERVKLAVYDLTELKETAIYTTSAYLLRKLFDELKVEINDKLVIKKVGTGFDTKYEAAILERATKSKEEVVTAKDNTTSKPKKVKLADAPPFE